MALAVKELISVAGLTICGLAIVKGSAAERWGGSFVIAAWSTTYLSQAIMAGSSSFVAIISAFWLCTDIMLACGFLWLALRFSSLWLAAAMMLQAMQLALYGSFLGSKGTHHNEYAAASNIQSGLLLLVILCATLISWRRRIVNRDRDLHNVQVLTID